MPFTLKDYPASLQEAQMGNDFACLPMLLKFPEKRDVTAVREVLVAYRKQVKSLRNVQLGLGFYYMMNYFVSVLRHNMVHSPHRVCNNYVSVFSCVPGPKAPLTFMGKAVREMFYIVPGVGRLGAGIGMVTAGGRVQATVQCDTSYFPAEMHREFLEKFEYIFTHGIDHL